MTANRDNLFASANLLAVQYPDDLSPELPIQLISFRNVLRKATELLYLNSHSLLPSFPYVAMAIKSCFSTLLLSGLRGDHFLNENS